MLNLNSETSRINFALNVKIFNKFLIYRKNF